MVEKTSNAIISKYHSYTKIADLTVRVTADELFERYHGHVA